MSDGMTDAYKARRRHEEYEKYLKAVGRYLTEPTKPHLSAAIDRTCGFYRKNPLVGKISDDELRNRARDSLAALKKGDHKAWAMLLAVAWQTREFALLKALSPFKDKLFLLIIEDDFGTVEVRGEIERFVPERGRIESKYFSRRHYVVTMDAPDKDSAETILIRDR